MNAAHAAPVDPQEAPPPTQDRSAPPRSGTWVVGVLGGVLAVILLPLAPLGLFVRPTSDDWCLIPLGRAGGLAAVAGDIYQSQNGRLGNGAANGLVFASYPVASKLLPGVVLLGLVLVVAGILTALLRYQLGAARMPAVVGGVTVSLAVVTVLLLAKPARYQTLFHAPTLVSHTVTILIASTVVLVAVALTRRGRHVAAVVATFLGCLVLGTFNEAFTGVCLVAVALTLAVRLFVLRAAGLRLALPVAAGAGLLLGFVSVYFSPGSQNRQQLIVSRSLTEPELWSQTGSNWWAVVSFVVVTPEVALLAAASLLTGLLLVRVPASLRGGRALVAAVLVPATWGVLGSLAAVFVLSYSFNGQLVARERTWPSITFPLLLAAAWLLVLLGAAVGTAVGTALATRRGPVLAGAVVAVLALPMAAFVVLDVRDLTKETVVRAADWDAQDLAIRQAVAQGARVIEVSPVPIDGLYEPFYPHRSRDWPARCLTSYYGVDEVLPAPIEP